ncbi:MAG: multidrug ABC transporter ATP-binding protein, partial [Firmicutes bacterium]|nr:multidrug ABC transporter ATP-binding protein [Bacillota bacterium]
MSNTTQTAQSNSQAAQMSMGRRGHGNIGAPVEKPKNGRQTLRRLLTYFRSQRVFVVLLFVIVTAAVILQVAAPSFLSRAIDCITARSFDKLPQILIIMLAIYLSGSICSMIQEIVSAHLSQRIVRSIRGELFGKTIHLPVSYLDSHSHGDLISRMTNDAENISNVVSQSLSSLFSGVLTLAGTVVIMVYFCWQLAILSSTTVFLTVFVSKFLAKRVRKYSRQ